ncbi:MAG: nucleotidyltransferase family protein [Azonexus sp.]|nr:nucleotidyltransferase family protein [Azonexus sp.]
MPDTSLIQTLAPLTPSPACGRGGKNRSRFNSPTVVVVAAGQGSRFRGLGHKLTQRLHGDSILAITLGHATATQFPVVIVTTATLAQMVRDASAKSRLVILPDAASPDVLEPGMGTSIAAGVRASAEASGWLILPADMPMIQTATLLAIAAQLPRHPVVFARYRGQRGHPVGFSAALRAELLGLTGDEGARSILLRHAAHGVEIDDPGVLIDIDSAADLARVRGLMLDRPAYSRIG